MIGRFTFLGTSFDLSDASRPIRDAVRMFWDVAELADLAIAARNRSVRVRSTGPLRAAQRRSFAVTGPDERGLVIESGAEHALVMSETLAASLVVDGDGFVIDVSGDESTQPLALHVALAEVVASSGLLPLHASVVTRDGRTVALTGPSGAGKTTSAMLAVLEGWRFVAEDSSWLDPVTCTVVGSDVDVRLRAGAESLLTAPLRAKLGLDLAALEHDGVKRVVPYAAVGGRTRVAMLDELVVLAPRDSPELDGPLRPAELAMALHQAAGVPLLGMVRSARAEIIRALTIRLSARRLSSPSGRSGLA